MSFVLRYFGSIAEHPEPRFPGEMPEVAIPGFMRAGINMFPGTLHLPHGATSIRSFSPLNEYYIPLRRAPEWDPQHCFKMSCKIVKVTVERYSSPLGIQHKAPRISWRFEGDAKGWKQASYDIKLVRAGKTEGYHVDKADSVFVPCPSEPLSSR